MQNERLEKLSKELWGRMIRAETCPEEFVSASYRIRAGTSKKKL